MLITHLATSCIVIGFGYADSINSKTFSTDSNTTFPKELSSADTETMFMLRE